MVSTIVLQVFVVIIILHGVQASFDRAIGSKLILYFTFDIFNSDESFIKLFLITCLLLESISVELTMFQKYLKKVKRLRILKIIIKDLIQ
jgi:hypothetical protein